MRKFKFLKRWIREPVRWAAFQYYDWWMKRNPSPSQYILILGHKRSGSTLLQHLIFGHDDVVGFGQNHTSYHSEDDLNFLKKNTYWLIRKLRMPHRFIIDKIVDFRRYSIADAYLQSEKFRFVFLLREPQPTLLSLMQDDISLLENSRQYYKRTLDSLVSCAEKINNPKRAFFLTHSQLLNQTPEVLAALQEFLSLEGPLSESYPVLRTTGYAWFGDFTNRIRKGEIVRERRTWKLSLEGLEEEEEAYARCCEVLSTLCTTTLPVDDDTSTES